MDMNCMEVRRMVTPFIKKELSDKEAEQFLKHIEHCSDCMDELDIYFTVYKALDTLDSGNHTEYDFRKLLHEEIRSVKRGILRRKVFHIMQGTLLVFVEILLLLSVYTTFEVQKVQMEQSTFHKAIHSLHAGDGLHFRAIEEKEEAEKTLELQQTPETGMTETSEMTETEEMAENK